MNLGFVATNAGDTISLATLPLDPVALGQRLGTMATIFERYRIVSLRIKYRTSLPTVFQGFLAMGVHDDATSATVPTTQTQVINYRCSAEAPIWKDFSLVYTPVDSTKWYYCNADAANDLRFVQPAVLYYIGTTSVGNYSTGTLTGLASSAVGLVEMDFIYDFVGATSISD